MNLMCFVRDVVIENLAVIRYRAYSVREAVNFLFVRSVFVKQA